MPIAALPATCAYARFWKVSASQRGLLSLGQAGPKQAEQARRFPNPFDQVIGAAGIPGKAQGVALTQNVPPPTHKTLDSVFERRLLLGGFIERYSKAVGRGPHRASQKRPFVERRGTPCTSTWQPPVPSAAARRWWSPTKTTLGEKTTPSTAASAAAGWPRQDSPGGNCSGTAR